MNLTIVDIINFAIIFLIASFLTVQIRLNHLIDKPNFYIKLILMLVLLNLVIDEAILLSKAELILFLHPFANFIYFLIYPLVYLYFNENYSLLNGIRKIKAYYFFIFPLIVLIVNLIIYLPLDHNEKLLFVSHYLGMSKVEFKAYADFQNFIIPSFYLQTAVIILLSVKLF